MKKLLLVLVLSGLIVLGSAQSILNYSFVPSTGTYTTLVGSTPLGLDGGTLDDGYYSVAPIGFTFYYMGQPYTTIGATTNGAAVLGGSAGASLITNNLTTGAPRPVLGPFWDDLEVDPTGQVSYLLTGAPGSQVFTLEWKNVFYNFTATTPSISFQIKLYEGSGIVEFVYNQEPGTQAGTPSTSIGITGLATGAGNFLSLDNSGASPTASSVTETTNINIRPATNQVYQFIPQGPTPAPATAITFSAITTTGMTVNWIDNSTNETYFIVQNSLDGISYSTVANVASSTIAATGGPYNYVATGLSSTTLYYWRIIAANESSAPSSPLDGTQATLPGTLCGTYTVGPTGAYPSLTAAFADAVLNGLLCPCNFELQAAYVSNVETFPLNIPFTGAGAGTPITVRPELGATNLIITDGTANTLFFNGSKYTTFDGRPGGLGTVSQLIIANTNPSFSAINISGDVSNCGGTFLSIQGVTTGTTNGVVSIGNAATTAGITNVSITNSLFSDGATNPQQYIYSANATAGSWTNMTLNNNTFEDWFSAGAASNAINVAAGNRGWNISNNSFYQTAPRTFTTGNTHNIVLISTSTASSGGNTISNNNFGGVDSLMTGYYTLSGAVATRFNVINASGNTSFATNTISNNTIKNFNVTTTSGTTTSPGIWSGIVAAGTTNSFDITNNIIGSNTNSDSIMVTTSGTGGISYGITSTATGAINISNNQIGGFKLYGSAATISTSFVGISSSAGSTVNIANNMVGSTSVLSNIRTNFSTGATAGRIDGIAVTGGTTSTVTNNTIAGITNYYNGTATAGSIRGVFVSASISSITNNTINNLATLAVQTNATTTPSAAGIMRTGTTNGHVISNNTISNIYNVAPSAATVVVGGLVYSTTATVGADNIINLNKISNLGAPLNTGTASIIGLNNLIGNIKVHNNFIDLGLDLTAASITAPNEFIGVSKATTGSSSFIFNSIRIAGTGVNGGATNTMAFRRTAIGATDTVKANIFTNFRSNGTSTGKHYSVSFNNNTTITSDRNVFFGNGTGYVFGSYAAADIVNLSSWVTAAANDTNSFFANPTFISATDLHINGAVTNIVESRAVGVTNIVTDIDTDSRPGPAGSVNGGGTAPDIGADEVDAFPVTTDVGISLLVKPTTSGCHTTPDSVIVRVRNYATANTIDFSVENVTINSSVTGPNPMVFAPVVLTSGTLAGGATMDITVGLNYAMNILGTYTFNASATTPLDFINSNDAMSPVNITISGGASNAGQDDICALGNVSLTNINSTLGGTLQWQISQNGISWSNIPLATANPYSYVDASTGPDTLYFRSMSCGADSSSIDSVIINYVISATTSDTSRCGPGLLDLYASGTGTLNWYLAPTGGSIVNTGTLYTPYLNATDTFYVENVSSGGGVESVGITTAGATSFITQAAGWGLTFTANTDFNLNSVTVYPTGTGTITVHITDMANTILASSAPFNLSGTGSATPVVVPVNLPITPGNYKIGMSSTGITNLVRNTTGVAYPYTSPSNAVTINAGANGGASTTATAYYWFFDWQITSGCAAPRTQLVATVTPSASINAYAVSGGNTCDNEVDTLVVSSANTSYAYQWTPSIGLDDPMAVITAANPLTTTTYYLEAIDTANCRNVDTVTIVVNPSPIINLLSSDSVICYGDTVNLYVVNGPYFYTDSTDVSVPDNNLTGVNTALLPISGVTGSMTINSIDSVCFNMTHTFTADMDIYLVSPLGTQMILVADEGGGGDNFIGTCFKPTATVPVVGSVAPFTGTFVPEDPLGFGAFNGENANGNWSLHLVDDLGGDLGTLTDWSIWFSAPNYAYSWNSTGGPLSDTANSIFVNPLVSTTYYLTATDTINGCEKVDTVVLVVYDQFALNSFASPAIVCAGATDTLVANASGGSGNYTYLWSDALGTGDSASVSGLPFDYTVGVTVTDNFGCGSLTDSVLIDLADPLSITSTDTAQCGPGTGFVLSSNVTGGNGINSYSWTGGSTADSTVTGLVSSTTNYTVTVTDGCGTTATSVSTVTINNPPTPNLGADIVQVNPPAILDAGAGYSSYAWSNSATTQTTSVSTNGSYTVTVTDANGCTGTDVIQVTFTAGINNPDGSTATVSYYPNPTNGILNMNIQGFMGKELKMEVMDLSGKVIKNYVFSEVTESYISQIDLTTLRAGTYMVVLYTNGDTYTHRIVLTTNY